MAATSAAHPNRVKRLSILIDSYTHSRLRAEQQNPKMSLSESLAQALRAVIRVIQRFWKRIPPDARKKIIASIIAALEELIREFYRRNRQKQK
jgi:predicted DNA-binding transcriptional regulator YafY